MMEEYNEEYVFYKDETDIYECSYYKRKARKRNQRHAGYNKAKKFFNLIRPCRIPQWLKRTLTHAELEKINNREDKCEERTMGIFRKTRDKARWKLIEEDRMNHFYQADNESFWKIEIEENAELCRLKACGANLK